MRVVHFPTTGRYSSQQFPLKRAALSGLAVGPILPRPRSRLQRSVDLGYKQSQPFGPKESYKV
jgi:hypothetical protein